MTLDTIVTTESVAPMDPEMAAFEEHRARGFGKFLTRADLAKLEGRPIGNVMSELQGLKVMRGHAGQAWVTSKRAPMSRCAMVNHGAMETCLA